MKKNRSKYLSYLLRHHPEDAGCTIDKEGWVDVKTLIKNTDFTLSELKSIVENNTRFAFSGYYSKIKAFHGHSCGNIEYKETTIVPQTLYHGTSVNNYKKIVVSGYIKSMSRTQVHLSSSEEKAMEIGLRHGDAIVLLIDAGKMLLDGFKFSISEDDVYLTNDIPIQYVKGVVK